MRNALLNLLRHDYYLGTLGVEKVYGSLAVDTPRENSFLVIRWEEQSVAFKGIGPRMVAILAHTKDADYGKIDQILNRVKALMSSVAQLPGTDGILSQTEWRGDSSDLRDGDWNTYYKSSSFSCNEGVI